MRYLLGVLLIVVGIGLLVLAAPTFVSTASALVRSASHGAGGASALISAGGVRFGLGAIAAVGGCTLILQSR